MVNKTIKCFCLEEAWCSSHTLKNPGSRACPGVSGTHTARQSFSAERCAVSPRQSGTCVSFKDCDPKPRSSGDLIVIWGSFLKCQCHVELFGHVILVLDAIFDALSNFHFKMILLSFCNRQLSNFSFKHLTAAVSSDLSFAWFSDPFWSKLRHSLPFF